MRLALILVILAGLPFYGQETCAQGVDVPSENRTIAAETQTPGLLDAGVTQEWVRLYRGPTGSRDSGNAIAVDGQGNVYVTGTRNFIPGITIKYNSIGEKLWIRQFGPKDRRSSPKTLAVDGQGNVYVTGTSWNSTESDYDYATVKYNTDGKILWGRRYSYKGPGSPQGLALDGLGNVYVTGKSKGNNTSYGHYDYATIKYDTDGNRQWVRRYQRPGKAIYGASALAVDSQGNVYVSGETDCFTTIKYDSAGTRQWVRRYVGDHSSSWTPEVKALAVDGQGNVYILGQLYTYNGADYVTIKYDTNGNFQWVRRYNSGDNRNDRPRALALDGQGNIYVTGTSFIDGVGICVTFKYDPDGHILWERSYHNPNGDYYTMAMALDGQGNVYITGYSWGGSNYDYSTIKYNTDGELQWEQIYNGPRNREDMAWALAADGQGNVYVTGESHRTFYDSDFCTIKYSQQ